MNKSALSLTEVIIVIVVVGILIAATAPRAFRGIEKTKIARVVQDAETVKVAAYAFYSDTRKWPGSNWNDDPKDPLQNADIGEGFVFKGDDPDMPATWNGPYLDKWQRNPWGGWYYWDYNHLDQNGDGIDREHVLWIDNIGISSANAGKRIPLASRIKIDQALDDGNLSTGRLQVWQGNYTTGNLGYIVIQGQ